MVEALGLAPAPIRAKRAVHTFTQTLMSGSEIMQADYSLKEHVDARFNLD